MKIHHLAKENSVLSHFLNEIRDINTQEDSTRFRRNIERVGEILSYEMSKELNYVSREITTVLETKSSQITSEDIVICSILKAGLPLHRDI